MWTIVRLFSELFSQNPPTGGSIEASLVESAPRTPTRVESRASGCVERLAMEGWTRPPRRLCASMNARTPLGLGKPPALRHTPPVVDGHLVSAQNVPGLRWAAGTDLDGTEIIAGSARGAQNLDGSCCRRVCSWRAPESGRRLLFIFRSGRRSPAGRPRGQRSSTLIRWRRNPQIRDRLAPREG
jgi:hypothetical protein